MDLHIYISPLKSSTNNVIVDLDLNLIKWVYIHLNTFKSISTNLFFVLNLSGFICI